MNAPIRLSYNAIDYHALTEILGNYEGIEHTKINLDFESQLASLCGVKHVVALNSGTAAIHLALKVLNVGPGDAVIVPTFTYVATVNPVLYLGAQPVLVDAERDTWNLDPELLEQCIQQLSRQGKRPKAIIVVHTYGMPAKLHQILAIANRFEIPVIEDAAESLGSTYFGYMTGTMGTAGIFSFNNNKAITTLGGGALVSNDNNLAERARYFASQARAKKMFYEHHHVGYNYLMSPLNAAYGMIGLSQFSNIIAKRRDTYHNYRERLRNVQSVDEPEGSRSCRWLSTVLLDNATTKERVVKQLGEAGIETRPLWNPMHMQPVFKDCTAHVNGVAEDLFSRGVCLPSGNDLSAEALEAVTSTINEVLDK